MTLSQFLTSALTPVADLRRGQHFMNELYRTDPRLYSLVFRTDLDPFYNDGKLWSTVKFVTALLMVNQKGPNFFL